MKEDDDYEDMFVNTQFNNIEWGDHCEAEKTRTDTFW